MALNEMLRPQRIPRHRVPFRWRNLPRVIGRLMPYAMLLASVCFFTAAFFAPDSAAPRPHTNRIDLAIERPIRFFGELVPDNPTHVIVIYYSPQGVFSDGNETLMHVVSPHARIWHLSVVTGQSRDGAVAEGWSCFSVEGHHSSFFVVGSTRMFVRRLMVGQLPADGVFNDVSTPRRIRVWGLADDENAREFEAYRADWERRGRVGLLDREEHEAGIASDFDGPGKHSRFLLSTITYRENEYENLQTFRMPRHIVELDIHFRKFMFQVDSNWGHTSFSAICRLQISGVLYEQAQAYDQPTVLSRVWPTNRPVDGSRDHRPAHRSHQLSKTCSLPSIPSSLASINEQTIDSPVQ